MTSEQKIELEYLIDLLREATKWNVDQGDDAIRLEIDFRINAILNGETPTDTEPDNLPAEEEPLTGSDYQALEAAKLNGHLDNGHLPDPGKAAKAVSEWKSKRVRCQENGHPVWRPLSQCHKENLFPNNPTAKKFRWVWDGPQDKNSNKEN